MHHYDYGESIPWGVEGRPGGVGSVDMRKYVASRWTIDNQGQRIDDEQRAAIAEFMWAARGTPYDWGAIASDTLHALRIPDLFRRDWRGQGVPGHAVCSAIAAAAYDYAGVPRPAGSGRYVTPADWTAWIVTRGWDRA